jgi:hypothetical protein
VRGTILLALLLVGIVYIASQPQADQGPNKRIEGKFRGVGINNCLESQGDFTPNLLFQVNGFAARYQENWISTAVFAGDGMTENVRGTTYFQGDPYVPGNFGAGTFVGDCVYKIEMNPNNSFTLKGSCNGDLPLGPAAGQKSTVEGIVAYGQLSDDGDTIIVGSPEPNHNTLTLRPSLYIAQRLCGTSATYVRIR